LDIPSKREALGSNPSNIKKKKKEKKTVKRVGVGII
jgi:hypothetical protein